MERGREYETRRVANKKMRGSTGLRGKAKRKDYKNMNPMITQAILWIVAGLFLTLLIIRRGRRKSKA